MAPARRPAAADRVGVGPATEADIAEALADWQAEEADEEEQEEGFDGAAADAEAAELSDEGSDHAEPDAAARSGGAARGRGRGRGRGGGKAGGGGTAVRDPAKWLSLEAANIPARPAFAGSEYPTLAPAYAHLTVGSKPEQFYEPFEPKADIEEEVKNSNLYKSHRHLQDGKEMYPNADKVTYKDIQYLGAARLLNGLDPARRKRAIWTQTFSVKGKRIADLFTQDRFKEVIASHHPADPRKRIDKGKPGYDNFYQVRPTLTRLNETSLKMSVGGKYKSVDEQTIGHQGGAPPGVKQKCGRFKAAGDGPQNDALCSWRGYVNTFCFRGDTTAPTVTIVGYGKKLAPLHQRCARCPSASHTHLHTHHAAARARRHHCAPTARSLVSATCGVRRVLLLYADAKLEAGSCVTVDNLYSSTELFSKLTVGCTINITYPDKTVRTVVLPPILHSGTLRSNRGVDPSITQQKLTLPADIETHNAKPILERTKVSVTNNAAKVMVLSIYDKKPFWMITSQHVKLEVRTVKRRRWNSDLRKPEWIDKEMLVIVDDYNHRMCFVDNSDRLAWHYSPDGMAGVR
jgi:hypothetical protein